ncbi:MAG: radical SAM protein [Phycisphaerae bacterium]|nr:radical SAM protein [Phycisphaerae bacterium]
MSSNRAEPMIVKYFSRAGLMLTDGCTAACASCYLSGRAGKGRWMDADMAVGIWAGLANLSPHGCKVHVTGGEPFIDWEKLIEILRAAAGEGLQAESVETNGFWATGDNIIRDRLRALEAAGMGRLAISADPFHQEFVPIGRVRRLAEVAREVLGPDRVRVRWEDWLEQGRDVQAMSFAQRDDLFAEWIATGRDRLNGRAAEMLAGFLPPKPPEAFAGQTCREAILRSRHVHVGSDGTVMPGVCAGLSIGRVTVPWEESVRGLWCALRENFSRRPILSRLIETGPTAILQLAHELGLSVPWEGKGFASKCHLCWAARFALAATGNYADELAPRDYYQPY